MRIPRRATSRHPSFARAIKPALLAEYAEVPNFPREPLIEPMSTMRPPLRPGSGQASPARITGMAWRSKRKAPRKFTLCTKSQSSTASFHTTASRETPAACTTRSRRRTSLHLCDRRSHRAGVSHVARSETRFCNRRTRHVSDAAHAPCSSNPAMMANPIAPDPPVTTAIFFSRETIHATPSVRLASTRWRYAPQSAAPIAPA